MPSSLSLKHYTVDVEGAPEVAGEGKPRRSALCPDKLIENHAVTSLWENFEKGVKASGDKPCLGVRPIVNGAAQAYSWETYNQIHKKAKDLGAGLVHRGVKVGDVVGVFSINRKEWTLTELGCAAYGITLVPLYDTLGPEAIEHIVHETDMTIVVASNDKLDILLKDRSRYSNIKTVVLMDGASDSEKEKGKDADLEIVALDEIMSNGASNPADVCPISGDNLLTIMYTSGTTGLPKGVMLSARNILSCIAGVDFYGQKGYGISITKDDVHLSYLPLAHIFERMVFGYCLGVGAAIGYYQGSPLKLLEDLESLKPTFFPSVPRLLNRIYDKINAKVEATGGISSVLFNMAVDSKRAGLKNGHINHWLWDRIVFSKVKERLGGRVKCIMTASAPISPEVLDFLRLGFSSEVHEAYGQTESCGGSTMTLYGDYESGHVGTCIPCVEIKLVDVTEMNYTSKDTPHPRGEICFRGPAVFKGYFKNEEKTKEALDSDGWLHSGDIGLWDEKGRLRIIDRKKNIFKLAQGEYIAPEKIENVYSKSKYVAQAFVYGDSLNAFLVAVIIPDEEVLSSKFPGSFEEVCKKEDVKKAIFDDMIKTGKELGLKSFEQVKDITLDTTLFSVENDLLTPTFKLKRPQAKEHYKAAIEEMNSRVSASESAKEKKQHLAEK